MDHSHLLHLVQERRQCLGALDVSLLGTLGATDEQHNQLTVTLHEIHAPARTEMNAQLRHPVADRLHVPHQAALQTLDARRDHPAHRRIGQTVQPCGKFGQEFYQEHR
ncbi:protein of unknown function [Candidatus Methylomirabilis oxygeniifera]|uniref:Uncharacterized protein n=1 Tax=Methylomirabilis oxygeniifera TaxID=671143 RepID=D5MHV1_METO1|nr:protein of unknown function [Candidatus Methylomirabilis oxyfera]